MAEIFANVWKSPCWSLYVRYAACRDEPSSARKIHRSTSFIIKVQDKSSAESTIMSVVHQIQGVWHDFMNLDVAAGVSGIVPAADIRGAVERCETLCKLSVLQGIRGVCCEREYGELARAYDSEAADCDGLITALCGEDEAALDKEMNQWFDALSRIDGKPHIRRIFVLWQGLRSG